MSYYLKDLGNFQGPPNYNFQSHLLVEIIIFDTYHTLNCLRNKISENGNWGHLIKDLNQ
jgi:hypothetical protein